MRTLILLVGLMAVTWIAGCGEEPVTSTATLGPDAVVPYADEVVPDRDRVPARPYDPATASKELAERVAIRPPVAKAGGLHIVVPDPPNGIFTCQDGVNAAAPGAIVTVLPATVVEDVLLYVPDLTFRAEGAVTLYGTLMVVADRVTVEGFNVFAPPDDATPFGIWIEGQTGAVVRDNTVSGWECAVHVMESSNASIQDNHILDSFVGVDLIFGSGHVLAGNTFGNLVFGVFAIESMANRIRDNMLSEVYLALVLDHSNGNTLLRNVVTAWDTALISAMSHENTISGNRLTAVSYGMDIFDSHFNRITDNKVFEAQYDGIMLNDSNGNTLLRNDTLGQGDDGLDVHGGSNGNTIIGTVSNGHADRGIELEDRTHENFIANSKAHGNANCDIVNYGVANVFQDNEADCTFGF